MKQNRSEHDYVIFQGLRANINSKNVSEDEALDKIAEKNANIVAVVEKRRTPPSTKIKVRTFHAHTIDAALQAEGFHPITAENLDR